MNSSLTKKINSLYKLQCVCEKLKDLYDVLHERFKLQVDEVLPEITADDANFTKIQKLKSYGSTGTVDFVVGVGKELRRKDDGSEYDQEWLQSLSEHGQYTTSKLSLSKSAIKAALKTGQLDEYDLDEMDLEEAETLKLTLSKRVDDAQVDAAIALGEDMVAEDNEAD